jgi:hypothetical protein
MQPSPSFSTPPNVAFNIIFNAASNAAFNAASDAAPAVRPLHSGRPARAVLLRNAVHSSLAREYASPPVPVLDGAVSFG